MYTTSVFSPPLSPLRYIWLVLRCYCWLFAGVACLLVGYMLVWQRGFYMDDYRLKLLAIDTSTGQWRSLWDTHWLPGFPVRMLTWVTVTVFAGLLDTHEFLVRIISTLIAGGNALLLGLLIYRIINSRLAAVIGSWLFLMPFYAQEAVLWVGAVSYVFATGLSLLFLHAFWGAFSETRAAERIRWMVLGIIAFVVSLLFYEWVALAVVLIPFFGLIAVAQGRLGGADLLRRAVLLTGLLCTAVVALYGLFYRNAQLLEVRGGIDVSVAGIMERSQQYLVRLVWMTVSPEWGQLLTADVFSAGLAVLSSSWHGVVLASITAALLAVTVLAWQPDEHEYRGRYAVGLAMLCAGITWSLTSLLFPSVLVRGQILEYRLLYFPLAGVGVVSGALGWIIAKLLKSAVWHKILLAVMGGLLLFDTICMVGYAQAFAARHELDRKQIAAVVRALPPQHLPRRTFIVPIQFDERLGVIGRSVAMLLVGVFEAPWSARAVLREVYGRDDFDVVTTNRWVPMRFGYVSGRGEAGQLVLRGAGASQGTTVPVDRTVLVSFDGNDAFLVERLTIVSAGGERCVVEFPIARELRQGGAPTIGNVEVSGE